MVMEEDDASEQNPQHAHPPTHTQHRPTDDVVQRVCRSLVCKGDPGEGRSEQSLSHAHHMMKR